MELVGSISAVRFPRSDFNRRPRLCGAPCTAAPRGKRNRCFGLRCTAAPGAERVEEEVGPAVRFSMEDFEVASHVSIGLQGRTDEVIYEATVCDPNHALYNSRVVLRQLTSVQAKRRGRRALEVLRKLARRQLMYDSYAMQVHGYLAQKENENDEGPFTLVHGYHGSYSLRHWLQLSDWLPTLEATLALNEERVKRVGDDSVGGPAVTRQLRLTRILMRDLLIGVNYLHSHGLAHTELRLENVHISPVDKHVKVGILGNAVDFYEKSEGENENKAESNIDRRELMIAFDMRCVGFIMAKLVLKELMDTKIFSDFKSFLTKGNDPSCLREFLLPILSRNSPSGNIGLQMLDRNWGAGWHLLSLLLATKPAERISCLNALRHPFLCGPKWRVNPSIDIIRWGLGSTVVRMAEDYIYGPHQRKRIADFIELMELLNPNPNLTRWLDLLPGKWRLLYSTSPHVGLTFRSPPLRPLISHSFLSFSPHSPSPSLSLSSLTSFSSLSPPWPHSKSSPLSSLLSSSSSLLLSPGVLLTGSHRTLSYGRVEGKESVQAVRFEIGEVGVEMRMGEGVGAGSGEPEALLREVRTQIPKEMFDLGRIVCGTYLDSRILILRGVGGAALFFTRAVV